MTRIDDDDVSKRRRLARSTKKWVEKIGVAERSMNNSTMMMEETEEGPTMMSRPDDEEEQR